MKLLSRLIKGASFHFGFGSLVGKTSPDSSASACPWPPGSRFTLTVSGPTLKTEQALKHLTPSSPGRWVLPSSSPQEDFQVFLPLM